MQTLKHSHNHAMPLLTTKTGSGVLHVVIHMLTVTSTAHFIMHLISSIPILLGLSGHAHDHSMGELAAMSFILNAILHVVMALMVVTYEKVKGSNQL